MRHATGLAAWRRRLALAPLALAATLAAAQPAPEDWRLERQEWTWELADGARIRVSNPWGDIAVRTHRHSEVYLLANWQHHADDERALALETDIGTNEVALTIDFESGDLADSEPPDWRLRRADITLFIPELTDSHLTTDSGTVEVRGARGRTTAQSATGDIKLRIFGGANARTEHGDVLAQLLRTDWAEPIEIATTTGSIRTEMPLGGHAAATIETRGEITSDYSMTIERPVGGQLKRATLAIGPNDFAAQGRMHLQSYSGAIKVVETLIKEEKGRHEE